MTGPGLRRGIQITMMICMVLGVGRWWFGCAPQERYHTLTFFFDGVPDPNAPPKPKRGLGGAHMTMMGQATTMVSMTTRHKPWENKQCASCHPMDWGASNGQMAYPIVDLCVKCHPKIPQAYPKMHGPVAVKASDWCHNPHEAEQPHLLKYPPRKLCGQCHEELSHSTKEHVDGVTSCLDCHGGHGGPKRFFLHPPPASTQAGTQPATQPTTQSATQPSGEPATQPASSPTNTQPAPARVPAAKEWL